MSLDEAGLRKSRCAEIYRDSYREPYDRGDLEEAAGGLAGVIDYAFNPPDGSEGSQESILVGAVLGAADWIERQPCRCTASSVADGVPCGRCYALGRIGDKPMGR